MNQLTDQELQIATERNKLNIARGDKLREFLKEYDAKFHDPEIKKIQELCEKTVGHKWTIDGYTVAGFEIKKCELCHLFKTNIKPTDTRYPSPFSETNIQLEKY